GRQADRSGGRRATGIRGLAALRGAACGSDERDALRGSPERTGDQRLPRGPWRTASVLGRSRAEHAAELATGRERAIRSRAGREPDVAGGRAVSADRLGASRGDVRTRAAAVDARRAVRWRTRRRAAAHARDREDLLVTRAQLRTSPSSFDIVFS